MKQAKKVQWKCYKSTKDGTTFWWHPDDRPPANAVELSRDEMDRRTRAPACSTCHGKGMVPGFRITDLWQTCRDCNGMGRPRQIYFVTLYLDREVYRAPEGFTRMITNYARGWSERDAIDSATQWLQQKYHLNVIRATARPAQERDPGRYVFAEQII